jgi:hypothetical protein
MMLSRSDIVIQQIVIGLLAVILVGGSVALALLGREIPNWLVGFDGVIVTAAFGQTGFFAVARMGQPTADALATSMDNAHQLALAGIQTANHSSPTGGASMPTTSEAA